VRPLHVGLWMVTLGAFGALGVAQDPKPRGESQEEKGTAVDPKPQDQSGEQSDSQSQRPSIAVMAFDFGTIKKQWWGDYDIGEGMADQIVNSLVSDGSFRVIERRKLDTILAEQDFARSDRAAEDAAKLAEVGKMLGVRYILAGSITKFATSDHKFGGGVVGSVAKGFFGPVGGLSFRKVKHEVKVTARLIDTTTGEIVVSTQVEGKSNKGQGVGVDTGLITGAVGVTFSMDSPDYRASGIGEAQEKATAALVQALVQKRPGPE
jgi:curli biogenesis system outer membrane secretion channel CsgG